MPQITAALILGCSALQLLFVFADAAGLPPYAAYQGGRAYTTSDWAVRPPWDKDAEMELSYGCCTPHIERISYIRTEKGVLGKIQIIVGQDPRNRGKDCTPGEDSDFTYVYIVRM